MEDPPENPISVAGGINQLGVDLLENILGKLPAKSFSLAACVSRTWNDISSRILSHPKLCSALSLNPLLPLAMEEVVNKVLSGPIRPHFAILSICPSVSLEEAHRFVTQKLGSGIPIITCDAAGIIGRDALTDQFDEIKFPFYGADYDEALDQPHLKGISLTVGYVPGLKVDAIPLSQTAPNVDEFVMDIRDYSASVSGCSSPEAIIMFGDSEADMNPVLEKLDYALSKQTIIAGNESCCFRCASGGKGLSYGAVGLVFAKDKTKSDNLGNIKFHFSVGAGVTAVGPTYKVASAKKWTHSFSTWITAKREGENETLDGQQMLDDVDGEIGPVLDYDLYIGITKRRKCSIGSEKVKPVTYVTYHPVRSGDEEYLHVRGSNIKTGDPFRFYVPNPKFALPLCGSVSENFGELKNKEIIGGFIFACCGRGSTFFEKPNVDSSPILDNFPGIPLSGMFCAGEIGRGPLNSVHSIEGQENSSPHSCLHVYSSVYLLMSYQPK